MDVFVWFLACTESEGILIYLDLIQPDRNLRRQRRHLSSGLNELDLWTATIQYIGLVNSLYTVVDHKVVSPHTYSQCRLPITHFCLGQVKHMIQSVLWRPQRQTIGSILDLKQLTS